MIREKTRNSIEKSIKSLQKKGIFPVFDIPKIKVERPEDELNGDYATNIAMATAKFIKKNPIEIARLIKSDLENQKSNLFQKIEVKEPGFINFFLSERFLQKIILEIVKDGKNYGCLKIGKNDFRSKKKTNIEFISANPTGPLHVGNGRGAFFGDCLANVLEKSGYQVIREYYINDAKNNNQIQELGKTALGEGKSYLTPYLKSLILKLKPHLNKFKSITDAGYFLSQNILNDTKKFIQERLKIRFDYWISEQILYRQERIKDFYNYLNDKKLVYSKEDACWMNLSKFNQKDEVLVKQNGQSTYFLADMAYHKYKIERGFKKIIDIWGADHQGHIPRMKAVMKVLGYKGDFDILITQIVNLKNEKMSKRRGKIVTLEWLIDEVGLDATRFFYLMKSLNTQMDFDVKLAKKQSKNNPVYYVQYANARMHSILAKSKIKNPRFAGRQEKSKINLELLSHQSELNLIKQLIRFPEIIEDTASDYQVQRIPQYALDLATSFHQFYRDCKVISKDKNLSQARVTLILATKTVFKNTLDLMGISAPEKM